MSLICDFTSLLDLRILVDFLVWSVFCSLLASSVNPAFLNIMQTSTLEMMKHPNDKGKNATAILCQHIVPEKQAVFPHAASHGMGQNSESNANDLTQKERINGLEHQRASYQSIPEPQQEII
jgi:hypothetical protein